MGAKTSIAESVDTLFCFTKISNHLVSFCFGCFYSEGMLKVYCLSKKSNMILCLMSTGRVNMDFSNQRFKRSMRTVFV